MKCLISSTQPAITCSKLRVETLEQGVKVTERNRLEILFLSSFLGAVFGSILLRSPIGDMAKNMNRRTQSQIAQKKAKFVFHFLVNDFRD